jgi:hypothetical protein
MPSNHSIFRGATPLFAELPDRLELRPIFPASGGALNPKKRTAGPGQLALQLAHNRHSSLPDKKRVAMTLASRTASQAGGEVPSRVSCMMPWVGSYPSDTSPILA